MDLDLVLDPSASSSRFSFLFSHYKNRSVSTYTILEIEIGTHRSFIVLKNDFSSEIPPFYGRGNRFSIAFCLLFYPTFQIFPLVLHILFSNHKPVDFRTVLFFRTQNTSKVKGNEEPRVEMDRRRSTAGRMCEATVSWSLLSPRGRSIISRQLSLTESRRENEFYDTRFPPPINDTFLLATSPDRKSQIKPRDLL